MGLSEQERKWSKQRRRSERRQRERAVIVALREMGWLDANYEIKTGP